MQSTWSVNMTVWTCPNDECTFDKQLRSGQRCPLCGKEAQAFNFNEFGTLLKEKWRHKKSMQKAKEREQIAKTVKFCPKCGSTNINLLVFYRPSMWKCLNCGYEGALMLLENDKPPEKNRKRPKMLK
jgi:ribosomal protein L37AE/L43A